MNSDYNTLSEGLSFSEMKGLIDSTVSIDRYTPKIGKNADVVVLSFDVFNEKAAADLCSFIETSAIEQLDVDMSPAVDEDGNFKVFVEFERDRELFKKIDGILADIDNITSKEGQWKYTAYKLDEPRPFDRDRFNRDVISNPGEYRRKWEATDAERVKERMEFLVKY